MGRSMYDPGDSQALPPPRQGRSQAQATRSIRALVPHAQMDPRCLHPSLQKVPCHAPCKITFSGAFESTPCAFYLRGSARGAPQPLLPALRAGGLVAAGAGPSASRANGRSARHHAPQRGGQNSLGAPPALVPINAVPWEADNRRRHFTAVPTANKDPRGGDVGDARVVKGAFLAITLSSHGCTPDDCSNCGVNPASGRPIRLGCAPPALVPGQGRALGRLMTGEKPWRQPRALGPHVAAESTHAPGRG
jgi:hypothetical protein